MMKTMDRIGKGKYWIPLRIMALGAMILLLPGEGGHGPDLRLPRIPHPQEISWDLVALISGAVFLISVGILAALLKGKGRNRN